QVIRLLSASIKHVYLNGWGNLHERHLSFCTQLLRGSTIQHLNISRPIIDDSTASLVLSFTSRVNKLDLELLSRPNLSNPTAFIAQLECAVSDSVEIADRFSNSASPFFGLTNEDWEKLLNKKLSNGSLECVEVTQNLRRQFTEAPIDLPFDTRIRMMRWWKKA
ncbi:hypothetical protein PMAYCL1PPCAC_27475, partial [Pristionchus mayeri]